MTIEAAGTLATTEHFLLRITGGDLTPDIAVATEDQQTFAGLGGLKAENFVRTAGFFWLSALLRAPHPRQPAR